MRPVPIIAALLTLVVALHLIGGMLLLTSFVGILSANPSISFIIIGIIIIIAAIVLVHLVGFMRTMHK
jgi:hypothetical protein